MNNGISYFPLDVHLDEKVELIEAEFGLKGFAIIVKLFQKIYGGQGYYCEWTNDIELLFAKRNGAGCGLVSQIVQECVAKGIFDSELFEKYQVLTSKGIQTRYLDAVSRRKKVEIQSEYLLLQVDQIPKNVSIFSKNANISSENVNIFKQSKGEKRKVKYSKVKESSVGHAPSPPSSPIETYESLIGTATKAVKSEIAGFIDGGVDKQLICRLIEYAAENGKCTWAYIRAAIRGNLEAGITTLDAYNKARDVRARVRKEQQERTAKKKRGINNYTDTNKPDYSGFVEGELAKLMKEDDDNDKL